MSTGKDFVISGKYTWICQKDNYTIIGLNNNILQDGEEVYSIELPEVGQAIEAENYFATVETANGLVEVLSPVSGQIVEINEEILTNLELLNHDPYEIGIALIDIDEDFDF